MADSTAQVKPISDLETGADLKHKLESLKRGRQWLEAQWKLGIAFYKGKQYTYYNKSLKRLETLPVEDGEKPRYRVRLVNNQIAPNSHALLAKLTKTKPVINATATSGKDADIKAAQLADQLLEDWWKDFHLDDKLQEALLWSIVTGQGYWKITWDKGAGSSMRFTLDPNGQVILDSALEDLFRDQLGQLGVQPQEQVVYMGDIKVEVLSPFDVYIDEAAKVMDEARFAICVHHMSPDEIKKRWPSMGDVKADEIATSPENLMPYGSQYQAQEPDSKAVNVGYFLPSPEIPNGRYVTWIDEKIVEDGPWPYPFTKLPIIKFPGLRVPGQVYDMGDVENAIPIQKDLNKTLSQVIEYKNLTLKPRVWAPTGSLNGVRLTSEPGAVYEFNPVGEHKPEVEQLPSLPPYVFEHLQSLRDDLKNAFGLADINEGTPPPNVEAGIAIDLLQEMATDRIAPRVLQMERALARAGDLMLAFAQKYYQEPRLVKAGGPQKAKRFNQADLQGGITISVETGSALPRTRAGRQQRILDYVDRGVLPLQQAYKYLDIADLEGLAARYEADEDQAYREHEKLIAGQPVNILAAQKAMQDVQSGQAQDQNGQPIQDPQAAQQYIKQQGLQPFVFEDYQTHMDTHALFMKSPEFGNLPPEIQQDFVDHYSNTLQTFFNLPKPVEYQAVRPTLQLKGTLGPTAAAGILNKAGVYDITPDTMHELPLETWVSDSLDKPDEGQAGNNPMDQLDMQLRMQDMQAKVQDAMIRSGTASHQMQALQQQRDNAQQAHDVKMQQLNEQMAMARDAHMAGERQKAQMHAERIRNARKPKPKAGK